jgi:hypothetical protein
MKMKKEHLAQLEDYLKDHPHAETTEDWEDEWDLDAWKKAGNPYVWHEHQVVENAALYVDSGYGNIALFVDDNLVDVGNKHIVWGKGWLGFCEENLDSACLYKKYEGA